MIDIFSIELFTLAGTKITLLKLITFALVLIFSYLFSKFVISRTLESILKRKGVKKESRASITKIIHYVILLIGLWVAFNILGITITALIAIAGIAGIIIGFGLQPIIANFISGLILMGERTVQVGDWIEIDGKYGRIIDSGVRSSTLETFDNLHVIIPNRNFVENAFINYSYKDNKIRIESPIGVKYGSDVKKVEEILLNIAEENENVLKKPEPVVFFSEFGDYALKFELKCWIRSPKYRKSTKSEINFEIDRIFAEEGITIPFPQMDVWLKSIAEQNKRKTKL